MQETYAIGKCICEALIKW